MTLRGVLRSARLPAPIWTVVAPARMNSAASSQRVTPPAAMIGVLVCLASCE